jgi:hypothetical protein
MTLVRGRCSRLHCISHLEAHNTVNRLPSNPKSTQSAAADVYIEICGNVTHRRSSCRCPIHGYCRLNPVSCYMWSSALGASVVALITLLCFGSPAVCNVASRQVADITLWSRNEWMTKEWDRRQSGWSAVRDITVTRYTVSAIKVPRQYQLALLVKVACLNTVLTLTFNFRTWKKTRHFTITTINWLMLLR